MAAAKPAAEAVFSRIARAAIERLEALKANGPVLRTDTPFLPSIDRLNNTLGLNRKQKLVPQEGEKATLPPGYHLINFVPDASPAELKEDGTYDEYKVGARFPRRMWAGGSIEWVRDNPLIIGEECQESTQLESAEVKRRKNGEEMIVTQLRKEISNSKGLALSEIRSWVYFPAFEEDFDWERFLLMMGERPLKMKTEFPRDPEALIEHYYRHNAATLFRFSALTFNGHKIHLDKIWARLMERHPAPVVHGPLNVILMLNLWRLWKYKDHEFGDGNDARLPKTMTYRNKKALYEGEHYGCGLYQTDKSASSCEMKMRKQNGDIAMEATIDF